MSEAPFDSPTNTTPSQMTPYPTTGNEPPATSASEPTSPLAPSSTANIPGAAVALLLLALAALCGLTLAGFHRLMSHPSTATVAIVAVTTVALCAGLFIGMRRRA